MVGMRLFLSISLFDFCSAQYIPLQSPVQDTAYIFNSFLWKKNNIQHATVSSDRCAESDSWSIIAPAELSQFQ